MTQYFIQALYQLYPQVTVTRGDIAYDVDNNQVEYDPVAVQDQADKMACKQQATEILSQTDWTTIADIALPENTPHLTNQSEFIAYRNVVRGYAVTPVANPEWPTQPQAQWSNT